MDPKTLMMHLNDPNWEFYVPRENHEKVPIKGTKNGLQHINGLFLPILCRNLSVIKNMDVREDDTFVVTYRTSVIKNMDVREDDTFVVTYPKSGTNWVAEICWLIQHNSDFEKAHKLHHITRSAFIDMGFSNELLKKIDSPRVFQSHLRYQFLPDNLENKAKIIYVVRNPKDIIVSLYYFAKTVPEDKFDGTMEELFEGFVKGEIMYDAWWDHINEYTKLKNIHIVHFEDLLEDSINETRRMAKYLGKDLSDEQLKSIIDFCSFDNLKKSPAFNLKLKPGDIHSTPSSNGTSEDTKSASKDQPEEIKLLRKGQIGDWKNHLNEDMWKKIDEIAATKLDYKKPFKYEPKN